MAEANSTRITAEERMREVQRLESEFDSLASHFADRIGLKDERSGWLHHLFSSSSK